MRYTKRFRALLESRQDVGVTRRLSAHMASHERDLVYARGRQEPLMVLDPRTPASELVAVRIEELDRVGFMQSFVGVCLLFTSLVSSVYALGSDMGALAVAVPAGGSGVWFLVKSWLNAVEIDRVRSVGDPMWMLRADVHRQYLLLQKAVAMLNASDPGFGVLDLVCEREAYAVEVLGEVDRLVRRNQSAAPQVDDLSREMARMAGEMRILAEEALERQRVITDAGVEAEALLARSPASLMTTVNDVAEQTSFVQSLLGVDDLDRALAGAGGVSGQGVGVG